MNTTVIRSVSMPRLRDLSQPPPECPKCGGSRRWKISPSQTSVVCDPCRALAARQEREAANIILPKRHYRWDWVNKGCPQCGSFEIVDERPARQGWKCLACQRPKDNKRSRGYDGEMSDYRALRLENQEAEHDRFMRYVSVQTELPAEWVPSPSNRDREPSPCVLWTGGPLGSGYGHFRRNDGTQVETHVYMTQAAGWVVPEGMVRNHICRNPKCLNLRHLEILTDYENRILGYGQPISDQWAVLRHSECAVCGSGLLDDLFVVHSDGRRVRQCPMCGYTDGDPNSARSKWQASQEDKHED